MATKLTQSICILILTFLVNNRSFAGDLQFRKYAGEFMSIGVDARAQAMGGAFSSLSAGVASLFYNPAGITSIQRPEFSFMHTQQMIASVNYDFLAAGFKQNDDRVIALGLVRLGIDNIKDSRQAQRIINQAGDWNIDFSQVRDFNASDYIFTLAVAQNWRKVWSWGVNLKLIRRNLAEYHANGFGLDFGVQRTFRQNIYLGLAVKNITTTLIAWDTGSKELVKPEMNLGLGYFISFLKLNSNLLPVIDLIIRAENRQQSASANLGSISLDYAAGLEYSYHRIIFIRGGLDEIQRLNLGVGLQIPHLRVDYAFTSYDSELGNSHRVGLLVSL
jgi:hypothetical protein